MIEEAGVVLEGQKFHQSQRNLLMYNPFYCNDSFVFFVGTSGRVIRAVVKGSRDALSTKFTTTGIFFKPRCYAKIKRSRPTLSRRSPFADMATFTFFSIDSDCQYSIHSISWLIASYHSNFSDRKALKPPFVLALPFTNCLYFFSKRTEHLVWYQLRPSTNRWRIAWTYLHRYRRFPGFKAWSVITMPKQCLLPQALAETSLGTPALSSTRERKKFVIAARLTSRSKYWPCFWP